MYELFYKYVTYTNSFNLHSNPMKYVLLVNPFCDLVKVNCRKVKKLVQDHKASNWQTTFQSQAV